MATDQYWPACVRQLESIAWCEGESFSPGIINKIFICPKSAIAAYPGWEPDSRKYSGEIKPLVTKNGNQISFVKIEFDASKSSAKSASVGEYPSQIFEDTLEIHVPGHSLSAGLAYDFMNTDLVVIYVDADETPHILGAMPHYKCTANIESDMGKLGESSETIITIKGYGKYPFAKLDGIFYFEGTKYSTGEISRPNIDSPVS